MFFVGVDLGQRQDFSAVAVVEREEQRLAFLPPTFECLHVRYLERVIRHPAMARGCRLVVDATGVGAPVVDLLRSARLPCRVTAVTITSGEQGQLQVASGQWPVTRKTVGGRHER